MKVTNITRLSEKYDQYDITTQNDDFFIRVGDTSILIHNSPSVIFGYDPADNQFFCGTKGVFAKTPKLVKTKNDLDEFGYSGELRKKLELSLEHLPKIVSSGIYQGDMMFTTGDIKGRTIDGEKLLTFTPNTITYAVPAGSNIAKQMQRAKVGIVIHTTYTGGPDFDSMTAQPGQVNIKNFKKSADVWFDDPYVTNVSGRATMTPSETLQVNKYLSKAGVEFRKMNRRDVDSLLLTFDKLPGSVAGVKIQTYVNNLIRNNKMIRPGQGMRFAQDYMNYIDEYFNEKVLPKLKSEAGRQRKIEERDELKKNIDINVIATLFDFMSNIYEAMTLLLNKLNSGVNSMKSFVADGDGYRVTSGEGFVISNKVSGNTYKIVDRMEFSRLNFLNNLKGFSN